MNPPRIGAHMSIAGGVDQAVLRGQSVNCDTIQIFIKSNVQWKMPPLKEGERERFFAARRESGIRPVIAHSSYLINLASADRNVGRKSVSSLKAELRRAGELGLPYLVIHPGSHGGMGEAVGIRKIAGALDLVFGAIPRNRVKILLETTAGQGTGLGYRFEQLAGIIAASDCPDRLGVCFDTCHVFAAGYDIRTEKSYRGVMKEFDHIIGFKRLMAIHLNDSKGSLGSRIDRHEHIGKGKIGKGAFAILLNDRRLAKVPMVLETPKGKKMMEDRRNLRVLRAMLR